MVKKAIKIKTNSRLHLGFISLETNNPYSYGGMGVCINKYPTVVRISPSTQFKSNLEKSHNNRILRFLKQYEYSTKVKIESISSPEKHIGLGSGSQLILAIEECIMKYYMTPSWPNIFGRKYRSGIGYNTYQYGGFILDSPKSIKKQSMPIFKFSFPKNWKIILLFDHTIKGLSGYQEKSFFLNNKDVKIREKLSDIILNNIVPSIIYNDFDIFSSALSKFQKITSSLYLTHQKSLYVSNDIEKVINKISNNFKIGAGQSSWGPTSYMIVDSKKDLNKILSILDKQISMYNNLAYNVVTAVNSGRRLF